MSSGLWAQRANHCAIQELPPRILSCQKRFNFIYGLHKKTIKGNLVIGIEPMSSGLWAQRANHCAIQELPPRILSCQKRFNFIYDQLTCEFCKIEMN